MIPLEPQKLNLSSAFDSFSDHWSPRIAAALNGQHVKCVKFAGDFVWHAHPNEDELFLVVEGRFRMDFRSHSVWLEKGELIVVPRGIEHKPFAEEEVSVLLFEPASTINTGEVEDEKTKTKLEWIQKD
jgi:mannose-6-phosphate isomerase-like protein (cupin superfamily)